MDKSVLSTECEPEGAQLAPRDQHHAGDVHPAQSGNLEVLVLVKVIKTTTTTSSRASLRRETRKEDMAARMATEATREDTYLIIVIIRL